MWGFDLNDTKQIEIAGVKWTVGVVPAFELARLNLRLRDASRDVDRARLDWLAAHPDVPAADRPAALVADAAFAAAAERAQVDCLPVWADVIRWGLKAWEGASIPRETERVSVAGESLEILTGRVARAICRSPLLAQRLASEILSANALSEDDLRGFPPPGP